jgi:hypothetical protein
MRRIKQEQPRIIAALPSCALDLSFNRNWLALLLLCNWYSDAKLRKGRVCHFKITEQFVHFLRKFPHLALVQGLAPSQNSAALWIR